MSGWSRPKNLPKKASRPGLSDMLDFGPELAPPPRASGDVTERIKRLVKQLEELNKRIDSLSDRV